MRTLLLAWLALFFPTQAHAITFDKALTKYGVKDKADFEKKMLNGAYDPQKPLDNQIKFQKDFVAIDGSEHYAFQLVKRYKKL